MLGWRISFFYITILLRLYFLFKRQEKGEIRRAFESVFADQRDKSQIKSITRSVFRGLRSHYYEKLFNAFSSAGTLRSFLKTHVESEGMGAIQEGLSKGKGVLLVTGHFGGIEFIPGYLAANNYPVTIVASFSSNHLRNISIQKADKFGAKLIDADNTPNIMRAILDNLRENRIVIALCDEIDEWRGGRHKKINFLGKQVNLDKTIDVLLKRGECALVFGLMHRNNDHGYKFLATSSEQMATQFQHSGYPSTGAMVLKFLEKYIYKFPDEWYLWQKYSKIGTLPFHGVRFQDPESLSLLSPSLRKVT